MKLLFYAKKLEGFGNKVLDVIQSLVPLSQIETHRTIESLNCKLRQPVNNLDTAVMLASNKEDLLDLLALRDLFWNLRIILIIPDRKSETVAMGHMLRPRFLSYADGDFKDAVDYTERTCIIVVEIDGASGTVQIGIVVDSVSEVLNVKGEEIEDTPTFGTKLNTDYILGMAKMEGGVKILLDIDRVLNSKEISVLEKAA